MFTPKSMYHICSYLFNPIWINWSLHHLRRFAQNVSIFLQNLNHDINNLIINKKCPENTNLGDQCSSNEGGGARRYDPDHRFFVCLHLP